MPTTDNNLSSVRYSPFIPMPIQVSRTGQNLPSQTGISSILRKITSCFSRCVLNMAQSIYNFCFNDPEGDLSRIGKFLFIAGASTMTVGGLLTTSGDEKGVVIGFIGLVLIITAALSEPEVRNNIQEETPFI